MTAVPYRGALFVLILIVGPAQAANWIMLQGTEPADAPAYRPFGRLGIDYQQTRGTESPAGPWKGQPLVLNQIPPKLDTDATIQSSYVRLGLRGRLLDGKLDYLVAPLAGDNPVAQNGTPNLKFTDVIEGVQMGKPDLVMGLLFDPKVKTLSW